jgi:hypothetical protein
MKLEVGYELFYWDPFMVVGSTEAHRYATVMKITEDPDYPVKVSALIPLAPDQTVKVVRPFVMEGFRQLKDFTLVPGELGPSFRSDATRMQEVYVKTARALKAANPEFAFLIQDV